MDFPGVGKKYFAGDEKWQNYIVTTRNIENNFLQNIWWENVKFPKS